MLHLLHRLRAEHGGQSYLKDKCQRYKFHYLIKSASFASAKQSDVPGTRLVLGCFQFNLADEFVPKFVPIML